MIAVILCNGQFPKKEYPLYLLRTADIIVCCDSNRNVQRLQKMGLEPTVIVGDMDSTPAKVQKQYASRIVRLAGQDDNDLAKAYNYIREHYWDVSDIHILGAGGKNEAHLVGNLGWLMEWQRNCAVFATANSEPTATEANGKPLTPNSKATEQTGTVNTKISATIPRVDMVSDYSTAFAIYPKCYSTESADRKVEPERIELHIGKGRKVSFFSTDPTLRICSTGLVWPLDQVDLSRWWMATLNRANADIITLQFSHPAPLLIILD